jgi:hypothetical protein
MAQRIGLVFVHGISQTEQDRSIMPSAFARRSEQYSSNVFESTSVAAWRSLGAWGKDLIDLELHPQRRDEAMSDVSDSIISVTKQCDKLVICGHSIGQIISLMALHWICRSGHLPTKFSLVTIGGPLGNPSLAVRAYLSWGRRVASLPLPINIMEWVDVWNSDDPICAHPVLGYNQPINASRVEQVVVSGHPWIGDPLKEHSSYLDSEHVWSILTASAHALRFLSS